MESVQQASISTQAKEETSSRKRDLDDLDVTLLTRVSSDSPIPEAKKVCVLGEESENPFEEEEKSVKPAVVRKQEEKKYMGVTQKVREETPKREMRSTCQSFVLDNPQQQVGPGVWLHPSRYVAPAACPSPATRT